MAAGVQERLPRSAPSALKVKAHEQTGVLGLLGTFFVGQLHQIICSLLLISVFVLNCQISCSDRWLRFHANHHIFLLIIF